MFDSAGGGSVILQESLAYQRSEGLGARLSYRVAAFIGTVSIRVLGKSRVGDPIPRAIDGIGRRNVIGLAICGDAKHDLVRRETSIEPGLDSLGGGAGLKIRTSVIQRSVGPDTRVTSPLTLQNESQICFWCETCEVPTLIS